MEEKEGKRNLTLLGKPRENSDGWITFGWGGSISHVDSWIYSGAIEALEQIFKEYPQTRLKFCGGESRLNYILDRFQHKEFWTAGVREDRVIRQEGVRPEHWPYVVSTFDVGLAPLDMRPTASNTWKPGEEKWEEGAYSYDERRSWLKGVEYLCAGVPWIGTRSETYIALQHHGVLVENGVENWYKAMRDMVEFLPSRKRLAQEKKRWALKKYTMEANIAEYVAVYERIGNLKRSKSNSILPNILWNKVEYAR